MTTEIDQTELRDQLSSITAGACFLAALATRPISLVALDKQLLLGPFDDQPELQKETIETLARFGWTWLEEQDSFAYYTGY